MGPRPRKAPDGARILAARTIRRSRKEAAMKQVLSELMILAACATLMLVAML